MFLKTLRILKNYWKKSIFPWKSHRLRQTFDQMNTYKVEQVKICILGNKIILFNFFAKKWQKISLVTKKWYNSDIFFKWHHLHHITLSLPSALLFPIVNVTFSVRVSNNVNSWVSGPPSMYVFFLFFAPVNIKHTKIELAHRKRYHFIAR